MKQFIIAAVILLIISPTVFAEFSDQEVILECGVIDLRGHSTLPSRNGNEPRGYYDYLYDLYHSYRGDNNTEEFYYFTRYSRNETGWVYEQADYEYAWADGLDPELADGSFNTTVSAADTDGWNPGPLGPFDYTPEFNKIGPQTSVLRTEYDESGNIILDEHFFMGELTEYTAYTYNSYNELTDKYRYTDGGNLLRDKKTVRFREEVLYGQSYSVKEICEYKYYDYSDTEPQTDEESGRTTSIRMMHPVDSYTGEDEQQTRFIRYGKINNNYRK
jgi:hypothetical protein